MNTLTRRKFSFGRLAKVAALVLLSGVSAMAFDGRGEERPGGAGQSHRPDAATGYTASDRKSEAGDATLPPADANCLFCGDTSPQKDKTGGPAKEAPLTVKEKFRYFISRSFLRPTPYATAITSGAFGEWIDDDHHHHARPGDFAADSLTRAARSFAFGTTASFFEKFAYAAIFKQDPRYHKSEKKGAGTRIGYAISRVFITRSDQGASQFNMSFLAGGLTSAAISNVWERDERRNTQDTMKRWGLHVGFTAVSNIFREFVGKK